MEAGYDQLLAEGWLVARRGSGTFVAEVGSVPAAAPGRGHRRAVPAPGGPARPVLRLPGGCPSCDGRSPATSPGPAECPAPPTRVLVTAGTTHGMALVLGALGPGVVGIEDPGYRAAVAVARQAGWRVLEDDYDSEFRYDVAPLPALTALGPAHSVYLGTASKALSPALRIDWLVARPELLGRIAARREARHDHPPWPTQLALLHLLREGHLDKLVRSARRVYAERADLVVSRLGHHGTVSGPVAGMYLTLLTGRDVARAVHEDCLAAGFDVPLLEELARTDPRAGLVVGFGGLSDDDLDRALDALGRALARHS